MTEWSRALDSVQVMVPELKKILTRAQFKTEDTNPTVQRCGRPNCESCLYLIEGSQLKFTNGQVFKIKNSFTCASGNLIYVITCRGCKENYIGQTGSTIRRRMTVHRQQIRDPSTRQIPLSEHIDLCGGQVKPNFYVFPIYQFHDNATVQERENKESFFIQKYRPKLNISNS